MNNQPFLSALESKEMIIHPHLEPLLSPSELQDMKCRIDREIPSVAHFLSYKEFCSRTVNFLFSFPLRLRSTTKIIRKKQKHYKNAVLKLEEWNGECVIVLCPNKIWLTKYYALKNSDRLTSQDFKA